MDSGCRVSGIGYRAPGKNNQRLTFRHSFGRTDRFSGLSPAQQHPTPDTRCPKRGFTLIEVIIVLFFMVVAAALILPRYGTFQRAGQARDTARNLMAYVREAREIAVESQRPVVMEIDPAARRIQLVYDDTMFPQQESAGVGVQTVGIDGRALPRPPLHYPEPLVVEMQPAGASLDPVMGGQFFVSPEGRIPDTDFLIQYGPDRGIIVTVRRQGTRVSIEDPNSLSPYMTGEVG